MCALSNQYLSYTPIKFITFFMARQPQWAYASSLMRSRDHSQTHHTQVCSGRVISPTQTPLPDNTQHSQQKDIHVPSGISQPASERLQTHTLDGQPLGSALLHSQELTIRENNAEMKRRSSSMCYIGTLIQMHICEYRLQNSVFSLSLNF